MEFVVSDIVLEADEECLTEHTSSDLRRVAASFKLRLSNADHTNKRRWLLWRDLWNEVAMTSNMCLLYFSVPLKHLISPFLQWSYPIHLVICITVSQFSVKPLYPLPMSTAYASAGKGTWSQTYKNSKFSLYMLVLSLQSTIFWGHCKIMRQIWIKYFSFDSHFRCKSFHFSGKKILIQEWVWHLSKRHMYSGLDQNY